MTLGTGTPQLRSTHSSRLNGVQLGQDHLLNLPDDVIFVLLSYCDQQSLARLAQVCRRLAHLVAQECVWLPTLRSLTAIQLRPGQWRKGWRHRIPAKERCRYATNWMKGNCQDIRLIHHGTKQLPWLQVDGHHVWVSYNNQIRCYQPQRDGSLRELARKSLRGHGDDVSRFVCRDNMVISGGRDRSIHAYSAISGECLVQYTNCHAGDIQAVDSYLDVAVSGSRDATIKIWSLQELTTQQALQRTIEADDRVWSLAMNPDGRSFTCGTAGINHVAPLRIWDTERGELLAILGNQYRHGAGVLDIQYESPHILYSCGYDTFARMWDTRTDHSKCVLQWEEPFDSTVYCVQSDGGNSVITGTARYGMVRLWDKRHTQPVQMYFVGRSSSRNSSPVYSMVHDMGHLYVALDKGVHMLDFTVE